MYMYIYKYRPSGQDWLLTPESFHKGYTVIVSQSITCGCPSFCESKPGHLVLQLV